ncbi:hypothetical protein [Corynebacterium liangguodongii]|uniref:hypothetical protein n=1 Tax=Corynebacterium liangguodongii TaxID=2079535 RepID=UPI0011B1F594|nr:hypothetical protein [Corynebacterium liangguodongii]
MTKTCVYRRQKQLAGAVCLTVFAITVLPSCGNLVYTDIEGKTGVALNASSEIEIYVQPCGTRIDQITISGELKQPTNEPNDTSAPSTGGNPDFGKLKADVPQQDLFAVNLSSPTAPWKIESPINLPADESAWLLISAFSSSQDKETAGVAVQKESLLQLQPGEILIGKSTVIGGSGTSIVTQEEFSQCAD